jgi:HipA-like protein
MSADLVVLLRGVRAGRIRNGSGGPRLVYDRDWRQRGDALPLSLSMPLDRA